MDGHLSDLQRLLKNEQKPDSFSAHFAQPLFINTSRTDLHRCMTFKVVKQLNPICAMKKFTKKNCNLFMRERLTIIKKLRDKHVMVMKNILESYWACRHKTIFHRFFKALMIPFLIGERVRPLEGFLNIITWNHQRSLLNTENFLR